MLAQVDDIQIPETFEPSSEDELQILDDNPLNPLGGDLDALVSTQISEDLWTSMLGELPCLSATNECVGQLQDLAIQNQRSLQVIDQRIELMTQKIEEARAQNRKSIRLSTFTPLVQSYLDLDNDASDRRRLGLFEKLGRIFTNPISAINEALSFIGVPLFESQFGLNSDAQNREIAISDLEVKLAQIQQERDKIKDALTKEVVLQVIEFDRYRREFQISQEIAKRSLLQFQLLKVDYLFGDSNTQTYLNAQNTIDQEKAKAYRAWAQLRSQLIQIKILVLGTAGF